VNSVKKVKFTRMLDQSYKSLMLLIFGRWFWLGGLSVTLCMAFFGSILHSSSQLPKVLAVSSFGSGIPLTRAGFAVLLQRVRKETLHRRENNRCPLNNPFPDVSPSLWKSIGSNEVLAILGEFPDGTFQPDLPVRWSEFSFFLAEFCGPDADFNALSNVKTSEGPEHSVIKDICSRGKDNSSEIVNFQEAVRLLQRVEESLRSRLQIHVVKGRVCDARTGDPISGARILLAGELTYSNQDGSFETNIFSERRLQEIFIAAEGYQSLLIKKNLSIQKDAEIFLNPRLATLQMKIMEENHKALTEAIFLLDGQPYAISNDGSLEISGLISGYYNVEIRGKNISPWKKLIHIDMPVSEQVVILQRIKG